MATDADSTISWACEAILRAWHQRLAHGTMQAMPGAGDAIGRVVLSEEEASPNYRLRKVQRRRTRQVSWEIVEVQSGVAVATGMTEREEALRIVRGWERLSQRLEGGLVGHILVN